MQTLDVVGSVTSKDLGVEEPGGTELILLRKGLLVGVVVDTGDLQEVLIHRRYDSMWSKSCGLDSNQVVCLSM